MSSSAVKIINPNSDVARRGQALQLNINAAIGLQEVLKSNLGPKGTLKMYVYDCYYYIYHDHSQVGRRCRRH